MRSSWNIEAVFGNASLTHYNTWDTKYFNHHQQQMSKQNGFETARENYKEGLIYVFTYLLVFNSISLKLK